MAKQLVIECPENNTELVKSKVKYLCTVVNCTHLALSRHVLRVQPVAAGGAGVRPPDVLQRSRRRRQSRRRRFAGPNADDHQPRRDHPRRHRGEGRAAMPGQESR